MPGDEDVTTQNSPNHAPSPLAMLSSPALNNGGTLSQMLKKRDFPVPAASLYRFVLTNSAFLKIYKEDNI